MQISLSREQLTNYVGRQFDALFPDGGKTGDLAKLIGHALERVERCFSKIGVKGYSDERGARFNHLHTDQYAVFLYYLSNSAFGAGVHPIAEKAYALNKSLHALDAFYEVGLPEIMLLVHPVGTVLGRAKYSDYFCCYQNCTTGANLENVYPVLGRGVVLYGGSRVIGGTELGDNTFVSTGTIAIDAGRLPPNSVVHGVHPQTKASPTRRDVIREVFKSGG
jgi:serine O-acetyltransferase